MNPCPVFGGVITDGKLTLNRPKDFQEYVRTLTGDVVVTVKKRGRIRSNQQNAYYWGVVVNMIAREIGDFPDEVHEAIKMKFLKVRDKPLPVARSTTSLSTGEMETYLANVRLWAQIELNIIIPLPNEIELPEYA